MVGGGALDSGVAFYLTALSAGGHWAAEIQRDWHDGESWGGGANGQKEPLAPGYCRSTTGPLHWLQALFRHLLHANQLSLAVPGWGGRHAGRVLATAPTLPKADWP